MIFPMMTTADHHKFERLGPWKIIIPTSEDPRTEPAHVHVTNNQCSDIRGKIWIGINENYPAGDTRRYIYKIADGTLPINSSTRKDIFDTLDEMFNRRLGRSLPPSSAC